MNVKKIALSLITGVLTLSGAAIAADKATKAKPYPLKTCVVSGEEINDKGDMKPHVFTYEGREIKLCCEGCLKDFKKDSAKYIKKIEEAEKAQKK